MLVCVYIYIYANPASPVAVAVCQRRTWVFRNLFAHKLLCQLVIYTPLTNSNRDRRSGKKDCSRQSFLAIVFVLKHSIVLGGVLASLAQSGGRVCKQSRKHANTIKQAKGTAKHQKKRTHKDSIKQKINQANNQSSTPSIKSNSQQRKKTNKPEEETLY